MILIDVVCWGVLFWRNRVIYKHRLSLVHFISFVWWDRVISRIDEKWEKIWKKWFECFSFHSSLCCLECLMKCLFQLLCECFQQIHINQSIPMTTCVRVMWNHSLIVIVNEMKCVREEGWLLNTNPTHRIALFPIILCFKVSVVILCEQNLETKIIKWRKWEVILKRMRVWRNGGKWEELQL